MGASVEKRRRMWRSLKRKRRNLPRNLRCKMTRSSFKGTNQVRVGMKKNGIVYDANKMDGMDHESERWEQVESSLRKYIDSVDAKRLGKAEFEKFQKKRARADKRKRDKKYKDIEFNRFKLDSFADIDETKALPVKLKGNTPLIRKIRETMHRVPSKPTRPLAEHRREYYQRLINKHGNNYKRMHNDPQLNFFQLTEARIAKDIKMWKGQFKKTRW